MINYKILDDINQYWFDNFPKYTVPAIEQDKKYHLQQQQAYNHTIEAINQDRAGNLEQAKNHIEQAKSLMPTSCVHHYNLGLTYIKLKNYRKALECFQASISRNDNFWQSHTALAFLSILGKSWYQGEKHLKKALALMGQDLYLELFLASALYAQNKCPEELFFNYSYPVKTLDEPDYDILPALTTDISSKMLDPGKKIIFVASDKSYFKPHLLPLIFSAIETNSECNFHIHLYNCGDEELEIIKSLRETFIDYEFSFSLENIDYQKINVQDRVYFSSVRFIRAYQLLNIYKNHTLIITDADILIRKNINLLNFLDDDNLHMGICYAASEPLWNTVCAGLSFYRHSKETMEFLKITSGFIVNNLIKGTAKWSVDQIAMYIAYDKLQTKNPVALMNIKQYLDTNFMPDSFIWAVVNQQKTEDNPYNDYKMSLLNKYLAKLPLELC